MSLLDLQEPEASEQGEASRSPAVNPRSTSGSSQDSRFTLCSWLVVLGPLILVLIGAWTYRWVQEDAFINFRIIGNLLAGHGPVFNIGERVEAYSDPLWLFTLAGAHEILPFLSLEWLSVILGLVGTASGMLLGGRAIQRFGSSRHDTVIIPLGLLIFSVVAGVWEFATSGLEMGMVFAWLGLSFWLLVRVERLRTSATCCAFVMGLGTLIRPELLLMSAVFLAGLTAVVAAPGWRGPESIRRRWVTPLLASVAMPLMYEVWRMAYFAMVVSNSALAKSAGGSDVPQGAYYVWNFVSTFALWIPFLLVLPLMAPRTRRWWTGGDRLGVIVLLTPVLAGTVDAAYVLHLGGDYMQARLLLPAFLALCMTVYIEANQLKRLSVIAVIGVVAWCAVCAGSLRYGLGNGWVHNMHDERNNWIADTGVRHPIDVSGYLQLVSLGGALNEVANRVSPMRQSMLVVSDPAAVASSRTEARSVVERQLHAFVASDIRPAESSMPFRVVVDMDNVGAIAYLAGPRVYVWDSLSIANPIGSHTTIAVRTIPGHEKSIGIEWMIARFGVPGVQYPVSRVLEPSIAAATKTLRCAPLSSYIHAITAPMTFAQAMSNITHAFAYTAMSFNPDPSNAERQLCEQEG